MHHIDDLIVHGGPSGFATETPETFGMSSLANINGLRIDGGI